VLSLRRPEGQQRETVRLLQALSRFDETPSELMIELVDGEYVALGTAEAVKAADVRRGLLEKLPTSEGDAINVKAVYELFAGARMGRTTIHDALVEHVQAGAVVRIGSGKKNDAYRYWRPHIDSFGTTGAPKESISEPDDRVDEEV
jgi:hypothetical protein